MLSKLSLVCVYEIPLLKSICRNRFDQWPQGGVSISRNRSLKTPEASEIFFIIINSL